MTGAAPVPERRRTAEPRPRTPLDAVSDGELERVADSLVALLLSAARNLGVIDWGATPAPERRRPPRRKEIA